jgi:thiol-disulfide isomerase/thioredoxin
MRKAALAVLLSLAIPALAIPPVPRPAKEFTFVQPNGQKSLLTSMKGKVVVIQFLFTWCQHCQAFSQKLSKLEKDFAAKNVQFMGVAFDDNVQPALATSYAAKYATTFPVAYAPRETVLDFLGISVMERLGVPQLAVIDKKGVIRVQSEAIGASGELQNEANLTKIINDLLAEGPGKASVKAAPAAPKATPDAAKKSE